MISSPKPEILAPAGSPESLLAAVRCGANAVYLGGNNLNARRSAANFDDEALENAVKYCHARGVSVYLALNTVVFDSELDTLASSVKTACRLGVDAVIIQDLAAAAFVKNCAPGLPLHASTQMSIHTPDGARQLEALGFSRVVLARELSKDEIIRISKGTSLSLECFVHGALCVCVSGQCYFSAMLGGRSGNRGLCAQPCRLPMSAGNRNYCLSLKDLSLIQNISGMARAGVSSLKIEGRMKRPEYVAAAVTACKRAVDGLAPDMETLARVFSRSGFTSGYFDGKPGLGMFGSRRREDVAAASPSLLASLADTYKNEAQAIPVTFDLTLGRGKPALLTASDGRFSATASGDIPQEAKTSPTTREKAEAALMKTGGTPFFVSNIITQIDGGLMLPASSLNALRREALEKLLALRGQSRPLAYDENPGLLKIRPRKTLKAPALRIRIACAGQLTRELADAAELVTIPAPELLKLDAALLKSYAEKIAVELPRVMFASEETLMPSLDFARRNCVFRACAGNLGSIKTARDLGFAVHGGFSLNITNTLALNEYEKLGLCDTTLSFELSRRRIAALGGEIPRGILAYGHLPLMAVRNCPVNTCKNCKDPAVTDRMGNKFPIVCGFGAAEVLNCVPLYLADRMGEFSGIDFYTLYFTAESSWQCEEILRQYQNSRETGEPKTRGLYFREVK